MYIIYYCYNTACLNSYIHDVLKEDLHKYFFLHSSCDNAAIPNTIIIVDVSNDDNFNHYIIVSFINTMQKT